MGQVKDDTYTDAVQGGSQFMDIFPCNDPTNPQYSNFQERLKSFASWPHSFLRPDLLAAAGLFYLRERDRCKCFYCNGGLQNWEHGDDPMAEHAKYFPQCEYVLQQKGPDYVSELNSKHPNLTRPGVGNSNVQFNHLSNAVQQLRTNVRPQPPAQTPMDIPPQNSEKPSSATRINKYEHVEEAKLFGFGEGLIKRLIDRKTLQNNEVPYASLSELITDLIQLEEQERSVEKIVVRQSLVPVNHQVRADGCRQMTNRTNSSLNQPPFRNQEAPEVLMCGVPTFGSNAVVKSQLQTALDESICKACFSHERSCAFMDCGHLCCCFECGQRIKRCPICNAKIRQAIRIYKT